MGRRAERGPWPGYKDPAEAAARVLLTSSGRVSRRGPDVEKPPWSEGLEIGVAAIDGEHRLLVELVKALEDALALGAPRERAGEILEQLIDYTRGHFLAEDLLMRLHAYPGYQAHVQEHDQLLGQLEQGRRSFRAGDSSLSREMVSDLQQWLSQHVRTADRSFASYLAGTGVKTGS